MLVRGELRCLVAKLDETRPKPIRVLIHDLRDPLAQPPTHLSTRETEGHASRDGSRKRDPFIERTREQHRLPQSRYARDHDLVAIDSWIGHQVIHGAREPPGPGG